MITTGTTASAAASFSNRVTGGGEDLQIVGVVEEEEYDCCSWPVSDPGGINIEGTTSHWHWDLAVVIQRSCATTSVGPSGIVCTPSLRTRPGLTNSAITVVFPRPAIAAGNCSAGLEAQVRGFEVLKLGSATDWNAVVRVTW
eukprot:CAMPEP_0206602274 /NCGR_PEP_ID=MMETSP0325_2-20121206/47279_1 /ASSEMBLY_ACC=CAM_ASM_000347 /TAXON_ID=2866 /ORGANISM="Crypthecodinium cohnii, Strain Seligo" /LENGTH=141 /DNA_ID=CAMNT_0054114709 /DNA_START=951 /DNA_END=1375 /DNA_ORIENTATION=+